MRGIEVRAETEASRHDFPLVASAVPTKATGEGSGRPPEARIAKRSGCRQGRALSVHPGFAAKPPPGRRQAIEAVSFLANATFKITFQKVEHRLPGLEPPPETIKVAGVDLD